LILAMTAAAALCRLSGFWFMRFVQLTPRVRAGLDAIPLAVMLGIIIPPALRGGVPEAIGIAATLLAVHLRCNELVAVLVGMASVAATRALL
jgi:uncharacterized membrane protein